MSWNLEHLSALSWTPMGETVTASEEALPLPLLAGATQDEITVLAAVGEGRA